MNTKLIAAAALFAVAGVAGYAAMSHANRTGDLAPAVSTAAPAVTLAKTEASGDAGALAPNGVYAGTTTSSGGFTGDVAEGSADAPVTVIEYASLTCPHCATFHGGAYKKLKEDYIETGKVRFIYRDYPLNDPALAASLVARCGGESKYLGFIDLFMSQQKRWSGAQDIMGELTAMARFGGLGREQLDACLRDADLGQSILDRMRAGAAQFGVESTPTIIVNGELLRGGGNYDTLKAKIDDLIE